MCVKEMADLLLNKSTLFWPISGVNGMITMKT